MKTLRRLYALLLYISMGLLMVPVAGCDSTVLEFPDDPVDPTLVNVTMKLEIDTRIDLYEPQSKTDADGHDVRWIVEIFKAGDDKTPIERKVVNGEKASDGKHTMTMDLALPALHYRVVAWMDYVDDGSVKDKYYITNSLGSIKILPNEDYIGDNDHKDSYSADYLMDLTKFKDVQNGTDTHIITLTRPMAKIEFITTDIAKFLDKVNAMAGTKNQDLSTIKVKLSYAGYFPSSFNAYTNKPNDAVTGLSFVTNMRPISEDDAHLTSDYVFVNGTSSAVVVNLNIYDGQGGFINEITGVNVPVIRGKHIIIKDEFLTRTYSPGIGIDPSFKDDINIEIPD